MKPIRVFLSHTDRGTVDEKATTAIAVELRRAGIEIWLDREHAAPDATEEQINLGAVPENPLFAHIVDALAESDAVLFIVSSTSLTREYVRLEFDPRVLFTEFQKSHPGIPPSELPFYMALVEPVSNPPPFWATLIDSVFPGRVLNLTHAGSTPLNLPLSLTTFIKAIAPERLLPLNPMSEWALRFSLESKAKTAPGCPDGIGASAWRKLEGLLGLGPLFPGNLSKLSPQTLRYGLYRIGDSARVSETAPPIVHFYLSLWTANILLRSPENRIDQDKDPAVQFILHGRLKEAIEMQDEEAKAAVLLQFGFGWLTSPVAPNAKLAAELLSEACEIFAGYGPNPLAVLAEIEYCIATGETPADKYIQMISALGVNTDEKDVTRLHHAVLDACFPGPRLEATDEYFQEAKKFLDSLHQASGDLKAGFA